MHIIINYLKSMFLWLILLSILGFIIFVIAYPIVKGDIHMLYMHVFLLFQLIICLGVLRLYNSVFHNTRIMVELSKKYQKLISEIPGFRKVIQDNSRVNSKAVESLRETLKGLKENTTHIDSLNEEIKKWRQMNYGNSSRNSGSNDQVGK